jgi:hypothetical protein
MYGYLTKEEKCKLHRSFVQLGVYAASRKKNWNEGRVLNDTVGTDLPVAYCKWRILCLFRFMSNNFIKWKLVYIPCNEYYET